MTTVSTLYSSGSGHTAKMAEAVAKGAAANDAKPNLLPIRSEDSNQGKPVETHPNKPRAVFAAL